ncbi:MAG: hypothetical protein RBS49_07570, partial [Sphaerochaeta sp.]|nr:hypothetical protein [Sphaerochaeta sp.]
TMFTLVNIGERAGSGLFNIFSVWKQQNWDTPILSETFNPERTTLRLIMDKSADISGKSADISGKSADIREPIRKYRH